MSEETVVESKEPVEVIFNDLEGARAQITKMATATKPDGSLAYPKKRFVYLVVAPGHNQFWVVSQNIGYARARALKVLEDVIQVTPVDSPTRGVGGPKTVEQLVAALSKEDIEKARAILAKMTGEAVAEQPATPPEVEGPVMNEAELDTLLAENKISKKAHAKRVAALKANAS